MVPIFKAGKDNIDSYVHNYRPMSLLSCFSKIFERVVYNQLYNHLQLNKLLYDSQYGFRKSHSTELAALELIDSIYKNLDQGKTPIAIFLDLSKAFDTIDHKILINKLHHCGCRNISLNWFKSYLTERSQYVVINDTISKTLRITTGVPQGSVLGPLLFLIYINDLSRATDTFKYILFADDTNLISNTCSFKNNSSQNNIDQISLNINVELGKISDWMSANKLSLNTSKSKFIIFSYRQKKMGENKIPTLNINGTPIERKRETNFLGLFINEHMNKAVRQRSDLLFIETSFWFEGSPCAVRTNTAGLGRLCTLFVFSTLLVFEHMHAVLSSILVLCCTMVTTKHCCYE